MGELWKSNWEETKQHHIDWWNHQGMVLGVSLWVTIGSRRPHAEVQDPGPPASPEQYWLDADYRARRNRHDLSRASFAGDILPLARCTIGPGNLATFLGSEPIFSFETVWFEPCITEPELHPPLVFDTQNKWWKTQIEVIQKTLTLSQGNYFVGCPDLIENIDTLASLRGTEKMLMDLIERPEWVRQKLAEINAVYFEAFQRIYDIIKLPDGSAAFEPFGLWGPGRTAKVQCDACAMVSPDMFQEFILPALKEQCEWLDFSVYHLDGSQAMCHLDSLLSIEALDAIEWTPEPGQPSGNEPRWFDFYRKVLDAGKSIQIVDASKTHVVPMIKELGPKGFYFGVCDFENEDEIIELAQEVEKYR